MKKIPEVQFKSNKALKVNGFEIVSSEELLSQEMPSDHDPHSYHRVNFYTIIFITKGSVNHLVDFEICNLNKGDCLLLSRNQIHAFDKHNDYNGFLVLFTDEFLLRYFSKRNLENHKALFGHYAGIRSFHSPDENLIFLSILSHELTVASPRVIADITASLLSIFLLKLSVKVEDQTKIPPTKDREYLFVFQRLIEKDYTNSRLAIYYANKMGITYKHLNVVCKAVVNKTAKQIIDEFVILEAKRYLVASPDSIKLISYRLGFDEPTNFRKYFRKHTNLSTKEFRQAFA